MATTVHEMYPKGVPHTLVLLSPLVTHGGNYYTVNRIKSYLEEKGFPCYLQDPDELQRNGSDSGHATRKVGVLLGIHALRTGAYMRAQDLPYILIMGGTDINVFCDDPGAMSVMTEAVYKARFVVCFSEQNKTKCQTLWPNIQPARLKVIPQAVQTFPSKIRLEDYTQSYNNNSIVQHLQAPQIPLLTHTHDIQQGVLINGEFKIIPSKNTHENSLLPDTFGSAQTHSTVLNPGDAQGRTHKRNTEQKTFTASAMNCLENATCNVCNGAINNQPHTNTLNHDTNSAMNDFSSAALPETDSLNNIFSKQTVEFQHHTSNNLNNNNTQSFTYPNFQQTNGSHKPTVFIFVGGIRPVKNPLYLVNTFQDWHAEDPSILYLMVGPKLDRTFCEEVFEQEINRRPGVVYIPGLHAADVHALVSQSFALVNTSDSEGMCLAILEAMNLGVPVLARDIPGNRSIVQDDQTGLLFASTQDFLYKAKLLLKDAKVRDKLVSGATAYVDKHHNVETEKQEYTQLLEQCLIDFYNSGEDVL